MKTITHPASKRLFALRNPTLLLGLILTISTSIFGSEPNQQWVARYNGPGNDNDHANALAVDSSGNIYVTGYSYGSSTGYDYATIKYNTDGNQVWEARYNGPGNDNDYANALAVDSSGNVYVTGYSYGGSGTYYDYATIKYSPDGNQVWEARYNGPGNDNDYANALAVDSSGNVYVTGYSTGSGTGYDYATIKYNSDGNQLWVIRYNGDANGHDNVSALAIDNSGDVYVTGYSDGNGTWQDYATIKYNSDGNQLWVRRYDGLGSTSDYGRAITVDNSGNVYVTGGSGGSGTGLDCATIKYGSDGNQLWVACYTRWYYDEAWAITVDNSGNVYVTGITNRTGPSSGDYVAIKYGPNGSQMWVADYNGPGNRKDEAHALAVDSSGNVYVTGYSYSSGSPLNYDYATVKYSPDGNQLWVARYDGPGNSNDAARDVAVDNWGNVYVTGYSTGSGTSIDYATIKYTRHCIYVDANATGANNGSSWANAYKYLQNALAAAEPNHEIWVAQGTYRPDRDTNHPGGTGSRTATFQLKNDVAIYGGFPSGGGNWASRGPNIYQTILSGDIGVADNNSDNSYHVVTGSGTNSTAILDGFTITKGNASQSGPPYNLERGGGMYNATGSPTITNCTFSYNSATNQGGGLSNTGSSPTLTNCTFSGNSASYRGGGMFNGSSSPTLTNCNFSGNSASSYGGGMYVSNNCNVTLTNCNSAATRHNPAEG